jgi:hypothetical protein
MAARQAFKEQLDLEARKKLFAAMAKKYPHHILAVIER